ncbi:5-(carboxyamino)imidazole ribonucleotide mutase [Curtobacterium herbarum]|uniref:N5-carboxyaminoimidazole ribonucleotide mutase n=1 Tax=Curtobacterium herbarum TaxID=150122 RepID=A0ABN1ZGZ9_9MICO|nr:5-(carboxyamino)imidazole ribonucleotide mutase [Curtobacterium herbarum]MBM7474987.1 5-(carboxyamino)imidazole ribonucleotide mutase [Curtobacterium herbarum]MCS6545630.1 5-(carboxyamino)imidazole ribonucleotide mutase [Curtobacterium herbarum]
MTDTTAPAPLVSIIMGSDSDWPTMRPAAEILDELEIPFEADVVSAHRTPDKMVRFGRAAAGRGIRVVIAGAGGAAHLPGMVASLTTLPVIGVPVQLARLDGLDSLLSIVQMPAGIPVATMAINGSANAGLLAARIIGSSEPAVAERLAEYATRLEQVVERKAAALRDQL